jgi:hypothetical protein
MVPPAPLRVARRAVILYTLMMRFTVETNPNHPKTKQWLEILPQWLDQLDVGSEMEPWDIGILTTPLGELDREQQADARWCGEASGVLGWAIQRVTMPTDFDPVDSNQVFQTLGFNPVGMVRSAEDLLTRASLQPKEELLAYYAKVRTVQCCLRIRGLRIPRATPIWQQMVRQQLDGLGIPEAAFADAQERMGGLSDEQSRKLLGNYVVREYVASWLVGKRDRYWGEDEEIGNEHGRD